MVNRPKKIRVWKLGNSETGALPSIEAMEKLEKVLDACKNEDVINIIWGPDLVVEEYDI